MSADPNKKSARTFQCRDVLWGTFEQMAHDLECSVDYLINDAMKQYARQRSQDNPRATYPAPPGHEASQPAVPGSGGPPSVPTRVAPPAFPPPAGNRLPPPPTSRASSSLSASRGPLPPPPAPPGRAPPPASHLSARTIPPPLPRAMPFVPGSNGSPVASGQAATLTLLYDGERVPINKDRFVIGRGKQASDLTLKDPNVSRQHAMIEFQNGVYFMVDMGSTNGIEFNNQRIARKQITEGDVFRICDHDLFFTYR